MTKINRGIAGFPTAFGELAFSMVPNAAYRAISLTAMVHLDWRLSLLVLVFTPLPALVGAPGSPEQTRPERRMLDLWTRVYSRFNEVSISMSARVTCGRPPSAGRRGVAGRGSRVAT